MTAEAQSAEKFSDERTALWIVSHNVGYIHEVLQNGSMYGRKTLNKIGGFIRRERPSLLLLQEVNAAAGRYLRKSGLDKNEFALVHSSEIVSTSDEEQNCSSSKDQYADALAVVYDERLLSFASATVRRRERCLIIEKAQLKSSGLTLGIINVHMSAIERWRVLNMSISREEIEKLESCCDIVILAGDFNSIAA
jgi:endonuclease/exonuclease/phosphatase family metal-dependent hydrolase